MRIITLILFVVFINSLYSQTIVVAVDSITGTPIRDVNLIFETDNFGAASNSEGEIIIPAKFKSGLARLTHINYNTKWVEINNSDKIIARLVPKIIENEETTIYGIKLTKENALFCESYLTRYYDKLNYFEAGDYLKNKSSLFIKDYGGLSGLKIISSRGMSSENTAVLFNNYKVNDLRTGTFDFSSVSINSIDKIEYYKTGEFGDFYNYPGGAVYITTGAFKNEQCASLTIRGGSNSTYSGILNYKNRIGGVYFNIIGEKSRSLNNYEYNFERKRLKRQNAQFSKIFLSGDMLIAGEKSGLKLYANYLESESGIPGYVISNNYNSSDAINNTRGSLGVLNYNLRLSETVLYSATAGINNQNLSIFNPDPILNNRDYETESEFIDCSLSNGIQFKVLGVYFSSGIAWSHSQIKSDFSYYPQKVKNPENKRDETRAFISSYYEINSSIINKIALNGLLNYAALKEKVMQNNSDSDLSLSVGVRLEPLEDDIIVKLSYLKNYRRPTFNERFYSSIFSEYELQKERSNSFNAGIERKLKFLGKTILSATYFYIVSENRILWTPSRLAIMIPRNVGKSKNEGVELSLNANLFDELLDISANYCYTEAKNKTKVSSNDNSYNKFLPYTPQNRINLSIALNINNFRFAAAGNYTGERFYTSDNNPYYKLHDYYVIDFFASYKFMLFNKTNSIGLSIYNALNEDYSIIQSYPSPLRTFLATLTMEIL